MGATEIMSGGLNFTATTTFSSSPAKTAMEAWLTERMRGTNFCEGESSSELRWVDAEFQTHRWQTLSYWLFPVCARSRSNPGGGFTWNGDNTSEETVPCVISVNTSFRRFIMAP